MDASSSSRDGAKNRSGATECVLKMGVRPPEQILVVKMGDDANFDRFSGVFTKPRVLGFREAKNLVEKGRTFYGSYSNLSCL